VTLGNTFNDENAVIKKILTNGIKDITVQT
jgi:hypothetical protein